MLWTKRFPPRPVSWFSVLKRGGGRVQVMARSFDDHPDVFIVFLSFVFCLCANTFATRDNEPRFLINLEIFKQTWKNHLFNESLEKLNWKKRRINNNKFVQEFIKKMPLGRRGTCPVENLIQIEILASLPQLFEKIKIRARSKSRKSSQNPIYNWEKSTLNLFY